MLLGALWNRSTAAEGENVPPTVVCNHGGPHSFRIIPLHGRILDVLIRVRFSFDLCLGRGSFVPCTSRDDDVKVSKTTLQPHEPEPSCPRHQVFSPCCRENHQAEWVYYGRLPPARRACRGRSTRPQRCFKKNRTDTIEDGMTRARGRTSQISAGGWFHTVSRV